MGVDSMLALAAALVGSGGIGAVLSWWWTRRETRRSAGNAADLARTKADSGEITNLQDVLENLLPKISELQEQTFHLADQLAEAERDLKAANGTIRELVQLVDGYVNDVLERHQDAADTASYRKLSTMVESLRTAETG